jgi:fatty acyl-ACP thioesterase B
MLMQDTCFIVWLVNRKCGHKANSEMWLWLQSVPVAVFENYELSSMTLKYRRECSQSDVLQSMCSPTSCTAELEKEAAVEVNGSGCSYTAGSQTSIPDLAKCVPPHLQFTHLLRLQVDGAEILRGKTQWRLKKSKHLH